MAYVTTNIRFEEEDYLRLKTEAAKRRMSLSAIVREKIKNKTQKTSKAKGSKLMEEIRKIAKENAKVTVGFDSVKALREIRYSDK